MVIVKATRESEAGLLPVGENLTKMGKYNQQLVKAGVNLTPEAKERGQRWRPEIARKK